MASALKLLSAKVLVRTFMLATLVSAGYAGKALLRADVRLMTKRFLTGPGRTSRILLVLFILTNLKSMPLAWTFRIFGAMIRHRLRMRKPLPPRALFHYTISSTRTSLLETDYNFHKSNSTYFSDLDASRSHLVMHLLGPGIKRAEDNATTQLVRDREGRVVRGRFGVGLGSVFCSFRKEIAPLQAYEIWSRILCWDRKWLYIVSHFVVQGRVRPAAWDGGSYWGQSGGLRKAGVSTKEEDEEAELQKHVIATAVSKYVFKLGRFTVHPALVIGASGLLPDRPGEGWRGGESGIGTPDELGDVDLLENQWDWKRVESERRRGMAMVDHLAALEGVHGVFDGGSDGALGRFSPG